MYPNERCEKTSCETCLHARKKFAQYLNPIEYQALENHKLCKVFKKGQYLFSSGDIPRYLFCIYSGQVKLFKEGINDRALIIRFENDKNVIGYRSLIANDIYRLSAVAMEDTKVCMIEKSYFIFLMQNHREMLTEITKKINDELELVQERMLSLAQKNIRERTAEFLLFLAKTYGMEADGKTLNINLSRQEFADYVGTSLESVIRIISEFDKDKIISTHRRKITILDMDQLIRTANVLQYTI